MISEAASAGRTGVMTMTVVSMTTYEVIRQVIINGLLVIIRLCNNSVYLPGSLAVVLKPFNQF